MEKNRQSVDWSQYFSKIQAVCPWSYGAWGSGEILITGWQGQVLDLGQWQAIVYKTGRGPRQTKKIATKLEPLFPEYEFLVSAPSYGANGTPVPVIIQQDRRILENLRRKLHQKPGIP